MGRTSTLFLRVCVRESVLVHREQLPHMKVYMQVCSVCIDLPLRVGLHPAVRVNFRCGSLAGKGSLFWKLWKSQRSRSAIKILFDHLLVMLRFSFSPFTNTSCTLHSLLFSSSSFTSCTPHLFSFCHYFIAFYKFLPPTPSSPSLIKLAGALIKCSSPSRPPPVGLGRALIPSPVLAALKSTARETGSFFHWLFA